VRARSGLFITLDGPGGVGKTTITGLLTDHLAIRGLDVHRTTEPSPTAIGNLIRRGTETYTGMALACLVAGDRHHHLAADIRPHRAAGQTVICDRYLPSSLVLQRIDGLDWDTVTALNAGVDQPDLAVILTADPAVIAARMTARGGHSRFERLPDAPRIESDLYHDTARRLTVAGWPVLTVDCTRAPAATARMLAEHILALHANREGS
jgi:dTMP kinase